MELVWYKMGKRRIYFRIDATSGVYCIKNNTNGMIYIGSSSTNIRKRIRKHLSLLSMRQHWNKKFQEDYNKFGKEDFSYTLLEKCENNVKDRETFFIQKYQSFKEEIGYNMCQTGFSPKGLRHTEESRKKYLERNNKGDKHWSFGKISPIKGRKKSVEHLKKMQDRGSRKTFICNETAKFFSNVGDVCRIMGLDQSSVRRCLVGKYQHTKGFTFSYLESL